MHILLFFSIIIWSAPCKIANYGVGVQSYDDLSGISLKKEGNAHETNSDTQKTTSITIYYATTDISVSSTSKLINLSTFISNVGGNLGLFVGFSVLGGLFYIYDFVAQYVSSRIIQ